MFKQAAGELRAKLMGSGRAWPGFETTRQAHASTPGATGVEGAGGSGGPGHPQKSHAIRLSEDSIKSENVAIPRMWFHGLK